MDFTYLKTDNEKVYKAYYTAISDLMANIKLFEGGINESEVPVIIAGIGYITPWTRDAAINTANAGGLLFPEVSENTLLSVLKQEKGKHYIDGEYWDRIIWVCGAWQHYLYTGNVEFLKLAYEASCNTMEYLEETEYDDSYGLFRGAACYGDGVAAYPDIYMTGESGIITVLKRKPELLVKKGVGLPMMALSTNCLYQRAYALMAKMAESLEKLGVAGDYNIVAHNEKARQMKESINRNFWMEDQGRYSYLIDPYGGSDAYEGMGNAFVLLFDIADDRQRQLVLANQHLTPQGIPCVWPSFARYDTEDGTGYGRHSGTVWPHIQAFWADAALQNGRTELFEKEFRMLSEKAVRDGHFYEIYHPDTGLPYGGWQERENRGITMWNSEKKQTWSATGYLRLIFRDIFGMKFTEESIVFEPWLPEDVNYIRLQNLKIRGVTLDVTVKRGNAAGGCEVFYQENTGKNLELVLEV